MISMNGVLGYGYVVSRKFIPDQYKNITGIHINKINGKIFIDVEPTCDTCPNAPFFIGREIEHVNSAVGYLESSTLKEEMEEEEKNMLAIQSAYEQVIGRKPANSPRWVMFTQFNSLS